MKDGEGSKTMLFTSTPSKRFAVLQKLDLVFLIDDNELSQVATIYDHHSHSYNCAWRPQSFCDGDCHV